MREQVLKLDQLCELLADAVAGANTQLATQSNRNPDGRGDVAAFIYRPSGAAVATRHDISHEALYGRFIYGVRELSFSVRCCVVSRVVGGQRQVVLQLHAPAWWRRVFRKVECRELRIGVCPECVIVQLYPASDGRMPKRGLPCVLTLCAENRAALEIELHRSTETVTFPRDSQPNMN
ncbi:hypothetical protein [Paraburkholderia oxyphila]|uniref:hypothetical protein n=1 Tax=Paraburkholderia oxyphila TaxID=614212 RepID=UPI000481352F|nr:hypothetical protein [Paraburkholderia oxyphila]